MYTDSEKAEGLEHNQTPNIIVSDMTDSLTSMIKFIYFDKLKYFEIFSILFKIIYSRHQYVDISKFQCIYASVQHNFGPAGLCTIIVRDYGKQRAYTLSCQFGKLHQTITVYLILLHVLQFTQQDYVLIM
ncbi:Phosphoserine aminotransferase [Paramecium bursaria]